MEKKTVIRKGKKQMRTGISILNRLKSLLLLESALDGKADVVNRIELVLLFLSKFSLRLYSQTCYAFVAGHAIESLAS